MNLSSLQNFLCKIGFKTEVLSKK